MKNKYQFSTHTAFKTSFSHVTSRLPTAVFLYLWLYCIWTCLYKNVNPRWALKKKTFMFKNLLFRLKTVLLQFLVLKKKESVIRWEMVSFFFFCWECTTSIEHFIFYNLSNDVYDNPEYIESISSTRHNMLTYCQLTLLETIYEDNRYLHDFLQTIIFALDTCFQECSNYTSNKIFYHSSEIPLWFSSKHSSEIPFCLVFRSSFLFFSALVYLLHASSIIRYLLHDSFIGTFDFLLLL